MTQINQVLAAGLNTPLSLLALNTSRPVSFWFDKATTSGDYTFYGVADSTTTTTTNAESLGTYTISAGQVLPNGLVNVLKQWPYVMIDSPGVATLYVNGDPAPASVEVSTAAPAASNYSALMDLTSLSALGVRVMASKNMTADDGFALYVTQDSTHNPAADGTNGALYAGNIFGGGSEQNSSVVIQAWPYAFTYRDPGLGSGTTAGTIIASGVDPGVGGSGDVNPTPSTLVLRGGDGSDWNTAAKLSAAGATLSATGRIKLATGAETIMGFRNAGNTADVAAMSKDVADAIEIGDATNGAAMTVQSGPTSGISILGGTGASRWLVGAAGTIAINTGVAGVINIANTANAQGVNIATGGAVMALVAGSATGASTTTLNSGSGGMSINSTGSASLTGNVDATVTATTGDALVQAAATATLSGNAGGTAISCAPGAGGVTISCAAGAGADISITPSTAGATVLLPVGAGAGNTGELRFRELAASGVNYTGFKSPDALAGDVMYTLPAADGVASAIGGGSALLSNGAGALSWTQLQSGTSSIGAAGVSAAIAANITANSRILITVKDFVGSTAVGLEAKAAGRTVGLSGGGGQFIVTAYDAAGAAVVGANGTTFDWMILG